jgi:hypothetical protein
MAENPPTKKRRVQDAEFSASSSINHLAPRNQSPVTFDGDSDGARVSSDGDDPQSGDGFDPVMIAAVVGEQLPSDVLQRLKDVSGGNTERGMQMFLFRRELYVDFVLAVNMYD